VPPLPTAGCEDRTLGLPWAPGAAVTGR
jgi:hypothetical protein